MALAVARTGGGSSYSVGCSATWNLDHEPRTRTAIHWPANARLQAITAKIAKDAELIMLEPTTRTEE